MANNLSFDQGATLSTVDSGLVAGTTSTYTTTASTAGFINGKWVTPLTTQTNTATPTVDATTGNAFLPVGPNQSCVLVFGQNLAGAIKMSQGPILGTLTGVTTTVGGLLDIPQAPALPNDFMVLGYSVIQAAPSASPWTPGTGSWTASGITASTIQRCSQLPSRPQAS